MLIYKVEIHTDYVVIIVFVTPHLTETKCN